MTDKQQADAFMKKVSEKGMALGLSALGKICALLGDPQNSVPCVHIAGTNGKGSVLAMISSCLTEAGVRAGSFSSPAVFADSPCACVNGKPVDEAVYLDVMDEIMTAYARLEANGEETPTAFEIELLCALMCFSRMGCELCVIECGMGGRDDATNIIDNDLVCVFTDTGLDHTSFLGGTPREIAENKAGILRCGCTAVAAPQSFPEALEAYREEAEDLGCRFVQCTMPEDIIPFGLDGQCFAYKGTAYKLGLCGAHQAENACAAVETLRALRRLGFFITEDAIADGLEKTVWHGRFECVSREPAVILDGAHNVPAANALAKTMDDHLIGKQITLLFGILADKQYEEVAEILAPKASRIVTFTPPSPRALDGKKLREICEKYTPSVSAGSVGEAVRLALDMTPADGVVCAAGSLYSLDEIRRSLASDAPSEKAELTLANRIMKNVLYITKMAELRRFERDRIFCGHDIPHCLDVARITMLICAEEGIEADPDVVYSASLLHDIGRTEEYANGTPHDFAGVDLAARILTQLECPPELSREIIRLIASHRSPKGKKSPLEAAFYTADKKSRLCFSCPAQDECCWDDSKKNMKITR